MAMIDWVAAVPAIDERLRHEPPAAVADLSCSDGWSLIALARARPAPTFVGWDDDDRQVAAARRNASEADLSQRVVFEVTPTTIPEGHAGRYDLVTSSTPLDHTEVAEVTIHRARTLVAATGLALLVQARPPGGLHDQARVAGFSEVQRVTIAHDSFAVYLLRP